MVVLPACGSIQVPVAMVVVLAAAQVSASVFLVKPCLVRERPSGERYWTHQAVLPAAVLYLRMEAMGVF